MAYVGGGFGSGIHNILEPLVYGIPVYFGPNCKKFREAQLAMDYSVGWVIHNAKELRDLTSIKLIGKAESDRVRQGVQALFEAEAGGSEAVVQYIGQYMH